MRPFLLAALIAAAAPGAAVAVPVTISFEISQLDNGDPSNGSGFFTFDDVVPAGGSFVDGEVGLEVIDAGISWLGVFFDETRIRVSGLVKGSLGEIQAWRIGATGGTGQCADNPVGCLSEMEAFDDFFATGGENSIAASIVLANEPGILRGSGSARIVPVESPTVPVPEPSVLALLALGLASVFAGLGMGRRGRSVTTRWPTATMMHA